MISVLKSMFGREKQQRKRPFCSVVIVAAGKGTRMKTGQNKQFMNLIDRPVLAYTLEAFEQCEWIDEIIVVTSEEGIVLCKEIVDISELIKVTKLIKGGQERQHSVYNGLQEISDKAELVAIHDGARPLVYPIHIQEVLEAALDTGGAALGVPLKDTVKRIDDQNNIIETVDRNTLWAVQTPQAFKVDLIRQAHKDAMHDNIQVTDDCMLVERMGVAIKMVQGSYDNIKITTPEDMYLARAIIENVEWEEVEDELE